MRATPSTIRLLAFSACLLTIPSIAFAQAPVQEEEKVKRYETLTTIHGTVYEKVEILQDDPHGVTFRHSAGIAKIPFAELSEAFRELYDYKLDDARNFLREHAPRKAPPRRRVIKVYRRAKPAAIRQYLPGTYTTHFGGCAVTLHGGSPGGAVFSSRFVTPSWVHPAPVAVPFNPVLWRQLQLCNHVALSRACRFQSVGGFGSVATKVHQHVRHPVAPSWPAPAIGAGRSVPAIGAGRGY